MKKHYVVFGSWKIRHNEPLHLKEKNLVLFPVQLKDDLNRQSIIINVDKDICFDNGISLDEDENKTLLTKCPSEDWFLTQVALAIIEVNGEDILIKQAALRIEPDNVQFMRVPDEYLQIKDRLILERIYEFYDNYHLYFSNHECYFNKVNETTELEQKFHFSSYHSYYQLMKKIYTIFNEDNFSDFKPKLTDEYQSWSFDNYLYEILENEKDDKGYVSAIQYCKKKNQWDDPMFMYKKKIYNNDALERWEKNYENQWVENDIQHMLEKYFEYPITPLPIWRRTRSDIGLESANGNIFMVNVDHCQIHNELSSNGRLQQCEIEYISTRGIPDEKKVYEDFYRLVDLMESIFNRLNLEPTKTYYSKLTFLQDYVQKGKAKV